MKSKKEISNKELRSFGLIFASGKLLIFGLFLPWLLDQQWPWIIAGVTAPAALLMLALLEPFYKTWMKTGTALGWINTRIVLGLMFFTIFLPISAVLFLLKKDPMNRLLDARVTTYRTESIKPPRNRMEHPF